MNGLGKVYGTPVKYKYSRREYGAIGLFPVNVHKYNFARKCARKIGGASEEPRYFILVAPMFAPNLG